MLDCAIIGGGPAAVAAALSLKRIAPEASITLFDAPEPAGRPRPGETLSPGAGVLLRSLGCWEAFQAAGFLESFGTLAAWGSGQSHENDFVFGLRGNGWRIDRPRFDHVLLDCVRLAGVEVDKNARLVSSSDGWNLVFRGFGVRARYVIDASGRRAAFAVQRGARRIAFDRLVALLRYEDDATAGDLQIEAFDSGWRYRAGLPGGRTVHALMTDSDLRPPRDGRAIVAAHSQHLDLAAGPGWAAAGDAAMTFDPLSSQGITKALRSGKLASFAAADWLFKGLCSANRYNTIVQAEYSEYLRVRREYYAQERRWPESPFWARRSGQQAL